MATIYPQYKVDHYHYLPGSINIEVFVLLAKNSASDGWHIPDDFTPTITRLNLQAANNLPAYPNAYVVGNGANNWPTSAAAKTAAQTDYNLLIVDRTTAYNASVLATGGTDANIITPFPDSPVSGPG